MVRAAQGALQRGPIRARGRGIGELRWSEDGPVAVTVGHAIFHAAHIIVASAEDALQERVQETSLHGAGLAPCPATTAEITTKRDTSEAHMDAMI